MKYPSLLRLVHGHLERISSQVFDQYHGQITELVKNHHGVYALYKKNRLYYVGLATNLRSRIKHHLKDRHSLKWDSFSLYLIRKVDYLKELESLVLHIAEPKGNSVRGRFAQSKNLIHELKRLMIERDRQQWDTILFSGSSRLNRKVKSKRTRKRKVANSRVPSLKGIFKSGTKLIGRYKGVEYIATVDKDGRVRLNGKIFNSPSLAGISIMGRTLNGWHFWRFEKGGEWVKLDEARKK